jgi:hypothetical protein
MAEFDYNAGRALSDRDGGYLGVGGSGMSDLRKPHRPSVSLWRTCRQNELSARFAEIDEQRYGSDDICRLYESAEYPLTRHGARS